MKGPVPGDMSGVRNGPGSRMRKEEELRRDLLRYRRLLFRRYRLLRAGALEDALDQAVSVAEVEHRLRAATWPEHATPQLRRLAGQCSAWTTRCEGAMADLQRRAGGLLFRERADEEIKIFLQKLFLREP